MLLSLMREVSSYRSSFLKKKKMKAVSTILSLLQVNKTSCKFRAFENIQLYVGDDDAHDQVYSLHRYCLQCDSGTIACLMKGDSIYKVDLFENSHSS